MTRSLVKNLLLCGSTLCFLAACGSGGDHLSVETDTGTGVAQRAVPIPETCEEVKHSLSSVGCLFYAVDLPNRNRWAGAPTVPFAVSVSNVQEETDVQVTVYKKSGGEWVSIDSAVLGPRSLHTFRALRSTDGDQDDPWVGLTSDGVYKIESDVPIVAYQFNPLDTGSFSTDASLLLPVEALDINYRVVSWYGIAFVPAYIAVVATEDGTKVRVNPAPGASPVSPSVPTPSPLQPIGEGPFEVNMKEGEVLHVYSTDSEQLTWTEVVSTNDKPIAVFSGVDCASIPSAQTCCCDHLEEQLPAATMWGRSVVAARAPLRNSVDLYNDWAFWQIVSASPENLLSFEVVPGTMAQTIDGDPFDFQDTVLQEGETLELQVRGYNHGGAPGDFLVTASKEIALIQYMSGADLVESYTTEAPPGDPAMVYVPPVEQFLSKYVVLVPDTWLFNELVLTRSVGLGVLVDDQLVSDKLFGKVGDAAFEVARVPTTPGVHVIESQNALSGIGVLVVGFDRHDSYAYAGGMGLKRIVEVY